MRIAGLLLVVAAIGCEPPPPGRVHADVEATRDDDDGRESEREFAAAHREEHARLVEDAIEPLRRADPIAAAQLGRGALAAAPLSLIDRRALADAVEPVWSHAGEIDEKWLEPDEVVILRALRFALERIHDEVGRQPSLRREPLVPIRAIEQLVDEIELRLIHGECEAACEPALAGLGDTLTSAHHQLEASSVASAHEATRRARALAERLRGLGERSAGASFAEAATALDAHAATLELLAAALRDAEVLDWTAPPSTIPGGKLEAIRRLPDQRPASRFLGVEERIDLPVDELWKLTKLHVARWQALRTELVPVEPSEDPPRPVDLERCNATRDRIAAGLAAIPEIDPPKLDCARWLTIRGDMTMTEAELVLALIDVGWIEPQRRAIRKQAPPAVALIGGQWSGEVHRHLRRVMMLARLNEPHARARALDEGRMALCRAGAALWIHGQMGPPDEARLLLGDGCALLGDETTLQAEVLADPRGALAGLGLSMIGDEPAAMAGFEQFWWAPLGLMRLLATPHGVHPDRFSLPSEEQPTREPAKVDVQFEQLSPSPDP